MNATKQDPEVGMGCTAYMYTDRLAYTVVEIIDAKTVVIQRDKVTRLSKYYESQKWLYQRDKDGGKITVTLRKNGAWVQRTVPTRGATNYVFGYRYEYEDPSF